LAGALFIDAQGHIRHRHFGEGDDEASEKVIQQLLSEAGHSGVLNHLVAIDARGAEAAPGSSVESPETYFGYTRAENFSSKEAVAQDQPQVYSARPEFLLNQWALVGNWTVEDDRAVANQPNTRFTYRFKARDLHLVLGAQDGKPVRFRVLIDGTPPGADHGGDIDAKGDGTVTDERLCQLVRQSGAIIERQFEIEFLDPGAQAFAFTFG
jgi:hypothetical protein